MCACVFARSNAHSLCISFSNNVRHCFSISIIAMCFNIMQCALNCPSCVSIHSSRSNLALTSIRLMQLHCHACAMHMRALATHRCTLHTRTHLRCEGDAVLLSHKLLFSLSLSLSHSTIHSASPFILPHRCVLRVQQSPSPPDSTCQPFNPFLTLLMNLFRIECLNFYLVPCRAVRVCPQLGFVGDAV